MEVIVEYDYVAEEPDELTIRKGEIIKDVSQFEEGWFIGCLDGKLGVFPDNFVKVLNETGKESSQNLATVETVKETKVHEANSNASSEPDNAGQQNLASHKPKRATGIGLGNIFSGKPIQLKQTSLKDVLKETDSNVEKAVDASHDCVRVLYPYEPTQPDELELQVDDVIEVLNKTTREEGWWQGKNLRTRKIGFFPDNFIVEIKGHDSVNDADTTVPGVKIGHPSPLGLPNGNASKNGTSTSTYSGSTLSEPPKLAVKPTNLSPAVGTKPFSQGTKAQGNRDIPKSTMNNVTGRIGPATDVTQATNNRSPNNHYRVAPDVTAPSGSHREETAKYQSTTSRTSTSDSVGQFLTGPTADRPKQAGRRLPSRFTGPNTTSVEGPARNSATIQSSEVRRTKSTIKDELPSHTDTSDRFNGSRRIFDSTGKNGGQFKATVSLERTEGMGGSADQVRSLDANQTTNRPDSRAQSQSQLATGNESATHADHQIKNILLQLNQLKETNDQLRSEIAYGQQILTDRLHSLTSELDEVRKQRAADAVELARLRKVLMQLDSKVLTSFASTAMPYNVSCANGGTQALTPRVEFQAGDAQSLRDEEEDFGVCNQMVGDSYGGPPFNKPSDIYQTNHAEKTKYTSNTNGMVLQTKPNKTF